MAKSGFRQCLVGLGSFVGVVILIYMYFLYNPYKATVHSNYDCIFGFSTGHVGTTTLSDINSYNRGKVNGLGLLFEGSNPLTATKIYVSQKQYGRNFTVNDEVKFVQNKLAPLLVNLQRIYGAQVLMDLGHYNLFYYRGLVEYFTSSKYASRRPDNICRQILFVRIRRPRLETAFSLYYKSSGKTITNICTDFTVNYCPYNNPQSVILHPPSRESWNNLTPFQQCLWLIDETNARWHKFRQQYPHIRVIELYWSSHKPGSLVSAINNISDILGLPLQPYSFSPEVNRVHAGSNNRNSSLEAQEESDQQYRKMMNYGSNPHFKLHRDS